MGSPVVGSSQTSTRNQMKKTVLTFGLIAGAVMSLMLIAMVPFIDDMWDVAEIIGYTSMVAAFLLVFFGIRSYRDNVGGGVIKFGRAVAVGLLIVVVANACYTATWEVMYFNYVPDFMEKYQANELQKARAEGKSEAELEAMRVKGVKDAERYKNPVINSAFTFLEPLPVGLVVTLVSAGILSRRRRVQGGAVVSV